MTNEQPEAVVLRLAREAAASIYSLDTSGGYACAADIRAGHRDNGFDVMVAQNAIRLAFEEAAKIAEREPVFGIGTYKDGYRAARLDIATAIRRAINGENDG